MPNNSKKVILTDITTASFIRAFNAFIAQGDFIALTRQFEHGYNRTGKGNQLNFEVNKATVYLIDSGVLLVEPDKFTNQSSLKKQVHKNKESTINSADVIKNIVISSGIHGNETAPIEIVQQLIIDIINRKTQTKHRTLFIIGNPVAMNIEKRFQVENLNRLFCGKHQAIAPCFEKYRAEELELYMSDFFTSQTANTDKNAANKIINYHYDLHTAIRHSKYEKFAIYPYQGNKSWDKEQLSFMESCGVNTILFSHAPTGTFSYFSSSKFSAHAFTIELGKVKAFGNNDMANFEQIIENLSALISAEDISLTEFENNDFNLFKVLGEITKKSEEFKLFIEDSASNFTDYPIETLLSTDKEQEYRTTQIGESIVFPNANVGCGQRAALMVIPTTLK